MKKGELELILKVGGAGGSISVWSVSAEDGTRSFVVKTDESTLKEFMDRGGSRTASVLKVKLCHYSLLRMLWLLLDTILGITCPHVSCIRTILTSYSRLS